MIQHIERDFDRGARPLYAHLVTLLEAAIARGDVPSGSRLLPERELATRLRISRTTVVSAYRELEARGLLRGYVGRGTFVCAAPEPSGAPFAWRGKIASGGAAVERSDDAGCDPAFVRHEPALARRRRARHRLLSHRRVPARDRPCAEEGRGSRLAPRSDRRTDRLSRGDRRALRRAGRQRARHRGGAAGAGPPGALSRGSRRRRHHRPSGLSRRDPVVPRGGCEADRLGRDQVRHRRARGPLRALSPEAALHEPDVPEPDRHHHADPPAARAADAGGALSDPDRRGRHLSRAVLRATRRRRRCTRSIRRTS